MRSVQSVNNTRRKFTYIASGLLLILAAVLFWARSSDAQQSASYDPYADSVAATKQVVLNADNAVGGPNGTSASLAGPGASITLDMGAGEEGTQALRLYLGQINAQVNVDVAFLDANKAVITSENRQLGVDVNPSTQNFAYNWTNYKKAYRFVRVSSALGGGVNVDAVEALGYIGSTPSQDTDGDGIPDRTEQQNGTNPLIPNPKPSTSTPVKPIPGASTGSQSGSDSARSVSGQVNAPPSVSSDKDGDGMADAWEREHGLNPNDATDATKDPDHDNLNNLTEYKIGTDPQKMDTDGDGMPDGWEYDHGLNATKNDADADPDGDYLTNLGEYRSNTDPNKADDLYVVFGRNCATDGTVWAWATVGLLLAFLAGWLFAWSMSRNNKKTSKTSKKNR